jgi:hypothetical protein
MVRTRPPAVVESVDRVVERDQADGEPTILKFQAGSAIDRTAIATGRDAVGAGGPTKRML